MDYNVGIGEFVVSENPEGIIKTYSLSTCVAIVVYCPVKKVMGLLHLQLPESGIDPEGGRRLPGRYADTGIPAMLSVFSSRYACLPGSLRVSVFGGMEAQGEDRFQIGQRNIKITKEILKKYGISPVYEDTGGNWIRTIYAYIFDGSVEVFRTEYYK